MPGLGDLPLLGRLFSNNRTDAAKTEVVLLITPRIVRNLIRPDAAQLEFSSGTEASSTGSALGPRPIDAPIPAPIPAPFPGPTPQTQQAPAPFISVQPFPALQPGGTATGAAPAPGMPPGNVPPGVVPGVTPPTPAPGSATGATPSIGPGAPVPITPGTPLR